MSHFPNSYVFNGSAQKKAYAMVATELNRMCRTKRKELRLKKLPHEFYICYVLAMNRKKT